MINIMEVVTREFICDLSGFNCGESSTSVPHNVFYTDMKNRCVSTAAADKLPVCFRNHKWLGAFLDTIEENNNSYSKDTDLSAGIWVLRFHDKYDDESHLVDHKLGRPSAKLNTPNEALEDIQERCFNHIRFNVSNMQSVLEWTFHVIVDRRLWKTVKFGCGPKGDWCDQNCGRGCRD